MAAKVSGQVQYSRNQKSPHFFWSTEDVVKCITWYEFLQIVVIYPASGRIARLTSSTMDLVEDANSWNTPQFFPPRMSLNNRIVIQ